MLVENCCVVVAMRRLLSNPEWGPLWIGRTIVEQEGFPLGKIPCLAEEAPIEVWPSYRRIGTRQEVANGKERLYLNKRQYVGIVYLCDEENAHMACVQAQDIDQYSDKLKWVVTKKWV